MARRRQGDAVSVELRADGRLALDGTLLDESDAVSRLAPRSEHGVLVLPDAHAEVGSLLRWVDLLQRGLDVPVRVGVRAPEP